MFWKIQFDDGLSGIGWLQFDEEMIAVGIYTEDGNPVNEAVGYHPIEFNSIPDWA